MPKRIEGYQCIICNTMYDTEAEAIRCEDKHKDRMKEAVIVAFNFQEKSNSFRRDAVNSGVVPKSVTVKFSDAPGDYGVFEIRYYGTQGI